MPEIRYYTVTQEREVKVAANSPADAVMIANKAFDGELTDSTQLPPGRVTTSVRERDISAREDY